MLEIGKGAYWEGFTTQDVNSSPYPENTVEYRAWLHGHEYASRVCSICGRSASKDLIRVYRGAGLSNPERYNITKEQFVCLFCYRLKCPPQEHVIYRWFEWEASIRSALQAVEKQNDEAPFREIKYYGLPTKYANGDVSKFHSFIIVTNGDRYDIKNPHVSDQADLMISLTKEQLEQIAKGTLTHV